MKDMKVLKYDEIKFDDNNIFLAQHTHIYERILENLSQDEANIYLIGLMLLEKSKEEGNYNEENEIYGVFEIEDILELSDYPVQETISIYSSLVDKAYIREEKFKGKDVKYFYY